MDVKAFAKEIIWYSEKSEDGRYVIPISIDFDFTVTSHSDWASGVIYENSGCFDVLKHLQDDYNCRFILNTMRTGERLNDAIRFIEERGIKLYGVGKNPLQDSENDLSGKIFSLFDIDDKNVGTPLVYKDGMRPYVDWKGVDKFLSPCLSNVCREIGKIEDDVLDEKKKCLGL